jgi:hypothetical protein
MATAQIEAITKSHDTVEVKKQLQYHDADDNLSEWELARMNSKTWSMEQE